jgi:DNA-binding transcriptional LysR family regulator
MLDLVAIHYAITVEKEKSFSSAARILKIRQPTISQRIRNLETAIGASLFVRNAKGAYPTESGKVFLDQCRGAIQGISDAAARAAQAGRGEQGSIRLGLQIPLSEDFLREILTHYKTSQPSINLEFIDGRQSQHMDDLKHRKIDICFLTSLSPQPELDAEEFWSVSAIIALPKSHALAKRKSLNWEDLKNEHFLAREQSASAHIIINNFKKRGWTPNIEFKDLKREDLLHLASIGLGFVITRMPEDRERHTDLVYLPIANTDLHVHFYGVWRSDNDNPAFHKFLELARSMAAERRHSCSS